MSNQKQKMKMNMYVHAEKNQPKKFLSIWKKKYSQIQALFVNFIITLTLKLIFPLEKTEAAEMAVG